jgi:hypothetical protein
MGLFTQPAKPCGEACRPICKMMVQRALLMKTKDDETCQRHDVTVEGDMRESLPVGMLGQAINPYMALNIKQIDRFMAAGDGHSVYPRRGTDCCVGKADLGRMLMVNSPEFLAPAGCRTWLPTVIIRPVHPSPSHPLVKPT